MVSRLTWQNVRPQLTPPAGMTYDKWIACAVQALGLRPAESCEAGVNDDLDEIRWAPRRGHAAVAATFSTSSVADNLIFVLGGRARGMNDFREGWETVHGGWTAERLVWREEMVLMNDGADGGQCCAVAGS